MRCIREQRFRLEVRESMSRMLFLPVVIEKDADGYFAYCPSLQGCYTQGDTYEEVIKNIKDAIRLHIEDRLADNGCGG